MTTAYTSLLGLALPVTGELSGTWGDTVNNSITSLLDSAIAGTTTLSTDADVTLTTTSGAANTAREAILLCSGARTVLRTITAPAQSKIYTVINATTGGFSVKIVGVGPTTGVTILAGESALIAWNGSDFIKISSNSVLGALTVTSLTDTGLTSGRVTYAGAGGLLQDSANLLFNGTTLTANTLNLTNALGTTYGGTGLTSFTANGVVYASSTSALATGSALVFDGTNLGLGVTPSGTYKLQVAGNGYFSTGLAISDTSAAVFGAWTSIQENGFYDAAGNFLHNAIKTSGANDTWNYRNTGFATRYKQLNSVHSWYIAPSGTAGAAITFTQALTLDTSGVLLVGLTSATGVAKLQVSGALKTTGFTVSTLPAGSVGMRTYVTDALAPTFGATVVAGGAVTIPVFYNGSNWIVC